MRVIKIQENGNGTEKESGNGNNQQKMPDEGYNANMNIVILLGNIVRLFYSVSSK